MDTKEKLETINNIAKFLSRAELKGSEVPAFNKCEAFLHELFEGTKAADSPKDD